jgi:hypothetical protein
VAADFEGGRFAGQIAADTSEGRAAVSVLGDFTGIDVFALAPVGFDSGKVDMSVDLATYGETEQALLGHLFGSADITLHDAHLTGFDLSRVGALSAAHGHPARAALLQAMTQGGSGGFSGSVAARVVHGKMSVAGSSVSSADGVVSFDGSYDMPAGTTDFSLGLTPAITNPPHYTVKLTGPLHDLKPQPDLATPRALHVGKKHLKS